MRQLPDSIEEAWANSFLSEFTESAKGELLATAHEEEVLPGQNVYRELPDPRFAFVALLISGMLRVYVTSPQGRRMAVRYVRPGNVLGLPAMLVGGAPAGAEVVIRGSMLRLDPLTLRRLAQTDPTVSWAIANELARQLTDDDHMRTANVFGSVRMRIARHLLELLTERDGRLVARVTQQELADSVGSVREVVARAMVSLRDEGVFVREGALVIVEHRERLEAVASAENG